MNKFCGKCGKENNSNAAFCPYCGEKMTEELPVTNVETVTPASRVNGFALAGFITALASSSITLWGLSFVPGVAAIIFSAIGLNKINKYNLRGKGFAIAGLIIGIASTAIGLFLSFIYLMAGLFE
jgi:uncharacterized membrane protein YvbJ